MSLTRDEVLRDAVLALGVPVAVVDQAAADGTLELLALEQTVTIEDPELDLVEVAERTGLDAAQLQGFWRALGFPDPRPGERVFNEADVEMLSDVVRFIEDGALDSELALQISRVIGSSLARIATALVDAAESQAASRRAEGLDDQDSVQAVVRGAEILPLMPRIMDLVWRRHLGAAARRRIIRAQADEGADVCVGFADLVGFTAQTQELPEPQLAEVVNRFETIAFDLTSAHDSRVVKMIGDEVMFLCDDMETGALLALDMAATYRQDDQLSDVRVGLAGGRVLERDGDVFGSVVNLASRITNVAFPGAVVVSSEMHDALEGDPRFQFRSLRSHYLKDIGRVPLWVLRGSADEVPQPFERERRRRAARRGFLFDRSSRPTAERVESALDGGVSAELRDATPAFTEEATTEQLRAISDAVLEADIDHDLRVELLADLAASRRLNELEAEARRRADDADLEAERRVAAAEAEARRKVEEVEAAARRQIEEALLEAEEKSRRANEDANRKVAQAAEAAERKAEAARRDARRKAKRKADRKKRAKRHGKSGQD